MYVFLFFFQKLAHLKAQMLETKNRLAELLFDLVIKMFLRDNYVHGDMHAGNLLCVHFFGSFRLISYFSPSGTILSRTK